MLNLCALLAVSRLEFKAQCYFVSQVFPYLCTGDYHTTLLTRVNKIMNMKHLTGSSSQ